MDAKQYLRDSTRTASGAFHAEIVNPAEVDFMLQAVIAAGGWADRIKRALFYGKKLGDSRWSTGSVSLVPEMADLIHAMLGGITEAAEVAEHARDVLTGAKPLDSVNLAEEFGDQLWYIALGLRYLDSNFGEAFDANIAKLRKRYPDKFTEAAAMDRDIAAERAVLEQATIVPADAPPFPEPEHGTYWEHTSGAIYQVLFLANLHDNPRYPRTVVYQGPNGNLWARRADDWFRSMSPVKPSEEPVPTEPQAAEPEWDPQP
jgi:NTP pyrophosphatase (non-canonical NTP hydrolase)